MIDTENTNEIKEAANEYAVIDLIRERWSPRQFSAKAVSKTEISQLLEAARWAASSGNEQPWRFIITYRNTGAFRKVFNCLSEFNRQWVENAPVLMLTAYKEKFDSGKDNFHALHDLGLAMGNMTAQAQSMGIAVHHMAGVDWKKAQEIFKVPEGYHITTAVAVGYYGGDIDQLEDDLQKSERAPRERILSSEFAAEGQWPELL